GCAEAHITLGWVHFRVGRWSEAADAFADALGLAAGSTRAMMGLALARCMLGRFEQSREALLRWLHDQPDSEQVSSLACFIESLGLPEDLLETYELALRVLGYPDLSVPGAAGSNPELLAAQGLLAQRIYESAWA